VRSQAVLDVNVDVDGSVVDAEESQTLELLEMLAGQNRAELTPLSTTQTYPARQRTQTKLYQSEVEEAREKESRKSKGTATQPHIVEEEATEEQRQEEPERPVKQEEPEVETLEETSHNWEEGARIGEAENPGPRSRPVAPSASCRQDGTTLPTKTPGREIIGGRLTTLTLSSSASSQHQPMSFQPIGTPGNDGQSSAEDLRPGWLARSQPESLHRARRGYPGVHADHQCGVCRHTVNRQERQTHAWYEGTRVGEAQNPGPAGRTYAEAVRYGRRPEVQKGQARSPTPTPVGRNAPQREC
jgi:hypothetical protein